MGMDTVILLWVLVAVLIIIKELLTSSMALMMDCLLHLIGLLAVISIMPTLVIVFQQQVMLIVMVIVM